MAKLEFDQLSRGALRPPSKWNPAMAPYIFMERNEFILLIFTKNRKAEEAAAALKQIAKSGKILSSQLKTSKRYCCRESTKHKHALRGRTLAGRSAHQFPNHPKSSKKNEQYRQNDKGWNF